MSCEKKLRFDVPEILDTSDRSVVNMIWAKGNWGYGEMGLSIRNGGRGGTVYLESFGV